MFKYCAGVKAREILCAGVKAKEIWCAGARARMLKSKRCKRAEIQQTAQNCDRTHLKRGERESGKGK